jgi:hypothetical protein
MLTKLKLLTLLDILKENKTVKFDYLKKHLNLNEDYALESLIFEAVNQNLLTGKIDHFNKTIKVLFVKPRLVFYDFQEYESIITKWIDNIDKSSSVIENEITSLRNDSHMFNLQLQISVDKLNDAKTQRNKQEVTANLINII